VGEAEKCGVRVEDGLAGLTDERNCGSPAGLREHWPRPDCFLWWVAARSGWSASTLRRRGPLEKCLLMIPSSANQI